ncbi:hypothetical protein [Solibacillus merdavium]|uniref:Uncharacterized protein n=1 Tax=Solibacillus merdavium TaxID=2762218 RepID=A0ABR8XPE6_9BACL|nr:hypothetical protein [Solibacillus merdavium]MBD8033823.1 hypothetical protein [Solibacillus merdavium]
MSSDTSAYLSSQSVISDTITAGIWEVPVAPACGVEDLVETVPGEESEPSTEQTANTSQEEKANPPQEETATVAITSSENEMDCVIVVGAPGLGAIDAGNSSDLACKKTDAPVLQVPVSEVSVSEPVTEVVPVSNDKVDCKKEDKNEAVKKDEEKDKDKDKNKDKDKAPEDVEAPASDKEADKKDPEKDEKEAEKDKAPEDVDAPANDEEKASEEAEAPASDKEKAEAPNQKELTPVEKEAKKDSGTKEGSGESKENMGQKSNNEGPTQPVRSPETTKEASEGSPLLQP